MVVTVSEPGLYKLIQRSNKPKAKRFDRWVRHEVLPSIRKTGGYLLNEAARLTAAASPEPREDFPLPRTLAEALRAYADEVEKREAAEAHAGALEAARAIDKPKVDYVDQYVDCTGTFSLADASRQVPPTTPSK